jgi:hypothetical protein
MTRSTDAASILSLDVLSDYLYWRQIFHGFGAGGVGGVGGVVPPEPPYGKTPSRNFARTATFAGSAAGHSRSAAFWMSSSRS